MSRAVEGCRITRNASSGTIDYVEVCEKCGAQGRTGHAAANTNITHGKDFTCRSCGKTQHVEIRAD